MTWNSQPPAQEVCFETLNKTLELGANFWNGGELYGTSDYNSLHLLNKYFTQYPENADKVVLSIKGGLKVGQLVPDGSEENIRRSVDDCVRLLDGTKKIDIFECARQDPKFPVEHTVEVLAKCVEEGKIGGIGLSEVDAETIRRAYVAMPITIDSKLMLTTSLDTRCIPSPPSRSKCRCGRPTSSRTALRRPVPSSRSPLLLTRLWAEVS